MEDLERRAKITTYIDCLRSGVLCYTVAEIEAMQRYNVDIKQRIAMKVAELVRDMMLRFGLSPTNDERRLMERHLEAVYSAVILGRRTSSVPVLARLNRLRDNAANNLRTLAILTGSRSNEEAELLDECESPQLSQISLF